MLLQTGSLIAACTVVLTAAFLGVVGLVSGRAVGIVTRLPLYVFAGAVAFVAVLLVTSHARHHGQTVLARAAVAGLSGFVLFGLGAEGLLYAVTSPETVVVSHVFIYLVSAAIIASGLGYWGVRNWHDVTDTFRRTGL
jgi:hypothetical protein